MERRMVEEKRLPGIKVSEGAELSIIRYGYSIVTIKGLRT